MLCWLFYKTECSNPDPLIAPINENPKMSCSTPTRNSTANISGKSHSESSGQKVDQALTKRYFHSLEEVLNRELKGRRFLDMALEDFCPAYLRRPLKENLGPLSLNPLDSGWSPNWEETSFLSMLKPIINSALKGANRHYFAVPTRTLQGTGADGFRLDFGIYRSATIISDENIG